MTVTLKQLTLAWRKAKVDLYYSTNPPLFEIVDYEENLLDNLEQLRQRINGKDQNGDSRIRAPHKDRWKRDLLRVKGGNHDYCIAGEIDVLALRQFQSSHRSPSKEFKPVPDGFNKDRVPARKVLLKGEQA